MGLQKHIDLDVTNSQDLWPYAVINIIQRVMEKGEHNHPHGSWKDIEREEHIDRASDHLNAYLFPQTGDKEDHLAHAFTRIMMALAIRDGLAGEETEFEKRRRLADERVAKSRAAKEDAHA